MKRASRDKLFERVMKWAINNGDKIKEFDKANVGGEFDKIKSAFATGELSDEEAAKYGPALVAVVLMLASLSPNKKVAAAAILLQTLDAPRWAGPLAASTLQASFNYGPAAVEGVSEAGDWVKDKWGWLKSKAREAQVEATAKLSELKQPAKEVALIPDAKDPHTKESAS